MNIEARPWKPQDLIDDLQTMIDEEPRYYTNANRATLCMAKGYLEEHFSEQKWIPVTERLPEDGTDVLAYQNRGEETRLVPANYGCGVWFDCFFDCEADHITHWMPLPQPPKEGE